MGGGHRILGDKQRDGVSMLYMHHLLMLINFFAVTQSASADALKEHVSK